MIASRRSILKGAAAAFASAPGCRAASAAAFIPPVDPIAGRKLVFDEPFDSLNPDVWYAGPKATTFDTGHYGRAAFARLEGEEGFSPYAIVDDAHATGGKALRITAKHIGRQMKVYGYYGNNNPEYQWIGGNIQTARKDGTILKGWRQGYFEARMWFPDHPLSWPAFWLMNGRSILHPATSLEIDIVEHKGWEHRTYGAYLHEWGKPGEHHEGTAVPVDRDLTKGYHRFGALIDGERLALYFEREPIRDSRTGAPLAWTIGRASELDRNQDVFWPLLTLTLRADVAYPAALPPPHLSADLLIDYFRVYA